MRFTVGVLVLLALWLAVPPGLHAVPPTLEPGEAVVFSEDFDNNDNNWSNLGAGTAEATIGADPLDSAVSAWYPTVFNSAVSFPGVYSLCRLPASVSVLDAPIAVYCRVRLDATNLNLGENNKFNVVLAEDNGAANAIAAGTNALAQLIMKPCALTAPSRIGYTATNPEGVPTNNFEANLSLYRFPATNFYVDLRLALTNNGDGTMTIAAFAFNTESNAYVSIGPAVTDAWVGSGQFRLLQVISRNAANATRTNVRAYFDSVAIAQAAAGFRLVHPQLIGTIFRVSLSTRANRLYTLEYKDSLPGSEWTALPGINGTGDLMTLEDTAATSASRFYRVRED